MKIELHRNAEKFLEKLSLKQKARILRAVYKLPKGDVAQLKGRTDFRLRVGDWRIIWLYQAYGILVTEIGNRGDVYK